MDPQELEGLLWAAASDGTQSKAHSMRAAFALTRLWRHDSDALCHVTSILARLGHVYEAAATCRRAFRIEPRQACATFCSLHFALWTCDFAALDALREHAVSAVEAAIAGE